MGTVHALISLLKAVWRRHTPPVVLAMGTKNIVTPQHAVAESSSHLKLPVGASHYSVLQILTRQIYRVTFEIVSSDLLKGTNLVFAHIPSWPHHGPVNFDISQTGIAFVAKPQEQHQSPHTSTSDVFFIPMTQIMALEYSFCLSPQMISGDGLSGVASLPTFGPSGEWVAYLKSINETESDSLKYVFEAEITDSELSPPSKVTEVMRIHNNNSRRMYTLQRTVDNPVILAYDRAPQRMAVRSLFAASDIGGQGCIFEFYHAGLGATYNLLKRIDLGPDSCVGLESMVHVNSRTNPRLVNQYKLLITSTNRDNPFRIYNHKTRNFVKLPSSNDKEENVNEGENVKGNEDEDEDIDKGNHEVEDGAEYGGEKPLRVKEKNEDRKRNRLGMERKSQDEGGYGSELKRKNGNEGKIRSNNKRKSESVDEGDNRMKMKAMRLDDETEDQDGEISTRSGTGRRDVQRSSGRISIASLLN